MKPGRTLTIRSSLALLVAACVIPVALMAVASIAYNYEREQAQLVRNSLVTTRATVQVIDRELSSTVRATQILSTSRPLQTGDIPAFYAQAQEAVRLQIGNNVVLSDTTGQQLINTRKPLGDPLPRHGNPDQLRRTFDGGLPLISDVYVGALLKRPLVSIDVPVFRDGKVVYDLSAIILPERFAKIIDDQRLPPSWIATVFDSTGTIVARNRAMDRFAGKKGAPALIKRMAEVQEDAFEITSLEGIPVLSVFSRSTVSNWTVAIGIPQQELTSVLQRLLWTVIIAVGLLLLITVTSAVAIGTRISRSVQGLSAPALALGFGQAVTVPAFHLKEADEVGQALMRASAMLQESQHRAYHDGLTGLANRALFDEIVDQQIAICHRTGNPLSVLYIDLDGFKAVNDVHGHATGDELLRAVALRVKNEIRPSDVTARLGGDEFAIVLINTGIEGALVVKNKLADSLSVPYVIGQSTVNVSASIGIATFPEAGTNCEELLHKADEAMYQSKADRRR
jgi:diguanylate cyclase (GGDEF)-like protein